MEMMHGRLDGWSCRLACPDCLGQLGIGLAHLAFQGLPPCCEVSLESVKRFYNFTKLTRTGGNIVLENAKVEMKLKIGGNECLMNNVKFVFSHEIATVGALLFGPDGAFITGSDILMDGGVTAAYWYGELAPG